MVSKGLEVLPCHDNGKLLLHNHSFLSAKLTPKICKCFHMLSNWTWYKQKTTRTEQSWCALPACHLLIHYLLLRTHCEAKQIYDQKICNSHWQLTQNRLRVVSRWGERWLRASHCIDLVPQCKLASISSLQQHMKQPGPSSHIREGSTYLTVSTFKTQLINGLTNENATR